MGWIDRTKNILIRLRQQGKTELEVRSIIEAAADKATVIVGYDAAGTAQQVNRASDSLDAMIYALKAVKVLKRMIESVPEELEKNKDSSREETNNWRRMHGLPMKRCRRRARHG